MNPDSARQTFFTESGDMLDEMERCLLLLEDNPSDAETMNALFRAVHTIKGSSGMFGLNEIMNFTHVAENLLDALRQGKVAFAPGMSGVFLHAHDHIRALLSFAQENPDQTLSDEISQEGAFIHREMKEFLGVSDEEKPSTSQKKEDHPVQNGGMLNKFWHISLRPSADLFRHGMDPYSFLQYLKKFGTIKNLAVVDEHLPSLDAMDPESCYIGFEISFESHASKEDIEGAFEFMGDDCAVRTLPPHSLIADFVQVLRDLPDSPMKLGEILVRIGTLSRRELEEALSLQKAHPGEETESVKPLSAIISEQGIVHQTVINAALEKQKIQNQSGDAAKRLIRIDADKLDHLINLVGELVISGANVRQLSSGKGRADLVESVSQMTRLIEEVRNSALNVRMVQIGETFARYKRVVRDLSKEMGKEIDLIINGAETELDKTLIEKISDPVMHLVRNAVDHGISLPDTRASAGKPRRGTIWLSAYHETGSIVIEVRDDGDGLNTERIRAKALSLGMINESDQLSEQDLHQLIFEPGFSTADKVTSVSGRGVGMDVVRRNIKSLRGNIQIESERGKGSVFKIQLPLTLAIIDGFSVEVAGMSYVLPLDMVTECIEVSVSDLTGKDGGNFLNLRGEVLPFLRMREFFLEGVNPSARENVVVVEYGRHKAGLVVDTLLGEFQTVIKPLGRVYSRMTWLSGATILGNGDIALILDVPMLIQFVKAQSQR